VLAVEAEAIKTAPLAAPLAEINPAIAFGPFKPTFESLKQYAVPDWFRDAKLGIWAVWGPESVPMQGDWYARNLYLQGGRQNQYHVEHYGHPSKFGFKDIIPLWKAEKWEPEQLMDLYQKAGAKYFCMIAMHHDNFDCWDSKFQRWNSVNMGPKRDIAGEWQKAAQKYGLRFGMTEHLAASWWFYSTAKGADTNGAMAGVPYDGTDSSYADLYWSGNEKPDGNYYLTNAPEAVKATWYNRVKDMIDRYHPDLVYSDSPLPYPDEYGRKLLAHYYNDSIHQHAGKLEAIYNCKEDSQGRWVQDLERGVMPGINPNPWQTDTCVGDWYYKTGIAYKSSATVLQMLADIVSKNGNLLLNFPPRPDGTLDEQEMKFLADLATWMPINGEAIFGTRPWLVYGEGPSKAKGGMFNEDNLRYTAQDIRFTTKGGALYALVLGWPDDHRIIIRSLATGSGKTATVNLLGHAGPLDSKQTHEGLIVTMPEQKPCEHVFALKIEGSDLKPMPVSSASVIGSDATGRILLPASEAEIHGDSPQYEQGGGKDQIGYWGNPADFVSWNIEVSKAGKYIVQVTYSCAAPGSAFTLETSAKKLDGVSKSTGSWSAYTTATLGEMALFAGKQTINFKPNTEPTWKSIGLKSIQLEPTDK
jgi:alpha-L-fucosidase